MFPKLFFSGTAGDSISARSLRTGGLVVVSQKELICIDPGPGTLSALLSSRDFDFEKLSAVFCSSSRSSDRVCFSHDVDAIFWVKTMGNLVPFRNEPSIPFRVYGDEMKSFFFRYPEVSLGYVSSPVEFPRCDILVLAFVPGSSYLRKASPKIAVLTKFSDSVLKDNPVYVARDLSVSSGVKVVSASDGMVLTPEDYGAVDDQKSLGLFS